MQHLINAIKGTISKPVLCETCRKPGSCCKNFALVSRFTKDNWKSEAESLLATHKIDYFKPVRVRPNPTTQNPDAVSVYFDCERLGLDGRCTNYNERPETCRVFEPGSDPLCAEYQHTLKGIPIKIEYTRRPL